ncbi:MAG: MoxR family ATPase [Candidatus Eremiobacteraeota bacterium]|nr:MoxR family ATPase [Candidatus Eremiobacteraeota bacterium]
MTHEELGRLYETLQKEMKKVIVGQDRVIEELAVCFFSGGHALLEGVPGTAKTLLSRTLSWLLKGQFSRIQFTPDLMPSDVVGTHIFDMKTQEFKLQKGPVFTNFLLADEINRTPPKTQSALLEAMEERQATIEGETIKLPEPFMVCATENPLEFEGTYPLPEAQLDRFMMKILISYPSFDEEREVIRKHHEGFDARDLARAGINPLGREAFDGAGELIRRVSVTEPLIDYVTELVRATRKSSQLSMGASPRGSVQLLLSSKTLAALKGRDYVIPDDVKALVCPVLRHRVMVKAEAEIDGITADSVLKGIVAQVNVPR